MSDESEAEDAMNTLIETCAPFLTAGLDQDADVLADYVETQTAQELADALFALVTLVTSVPEELASVVIGRQRL